MAGRVTLRLRTPKRAPLTTMLSAARRDRGLPRLFARGTTNLKPCATTSTVPLRLTRAARRGISRHPGGIDPGLRLRQSDRAGHTDLTDTGRL